MRTLRTYWRLFKSVVRKLGIKIFPRLVRIYDSKKHHFVYRTLKFDELTGDELQQCSQLFSEHYGVYSENAPDSLRGRRIKMSPQFYKKIYENRDDTYISICKDRNTIVGQVIFILGQINDGERFCWVTQLVVNGEYQRLGIGQRLLNSAWCISDLDIRGLATANAITLDILESVTLRNIDVSAIEQKKSVVEEILGNVPFAHVDGVEIDTKRCQIYTDFYPRLEETNSKPKYKKFTESLGVITPGFEWLGLVFKEQQIRKDVKSLEKYLSFSEEALLDSYNRMNISMQPWARSSGAREEINYIVNYIKKQGITSKNISILDVGCGVGRHSIELARIGYNDITAIDFAKSQITKAINSANEESLSINFINADARLFRKKKSYDLILCLYDVIGSFRDERHNNKILDNISASVKRGGYAIISVMNIESMSNLHDKSVSLKQNPEQLVMMTSSSSMRMSGEVFDDNYVYNIDDGLVYRKEQFMSNHQLFAEYVIATKRYKIQEIEDIVTQKGFDVEQCFYVKAGRWSKSFELNDPSFKEILVIAKKR